MKFANPCADMDDKCEGRKCMWYVGINGEESCAVAWNAVSFNANAGHINLAIRSAEAII